MPPSHIIGYVLINNIVKLFHHSQHSYIVILTFLRIKEEKKTFNDVMLGIIVLRNIYAILVTQIFMSSYEYRYDLLYYRTTTTILSYLLDFFFIIQRHSN